MTDTCGVIRENFREYLDHLLRDGYSVRHDEHSVGPRPHRPGGNPVETWREDYPYDERLDRDVYEEEKYQLQIELLKFQYWAQDTGTKHVMLFEGRDAAGKARQAVHRAPQPSRRPRRRADQTDGDRAGSVVLPPLRHPTADRRGDRPVRPVLYNRAGVERVMGFCTERDYEVFLQALLFEEMLLESGFSLTKLWFSVAQSEQRTDRH